MFSFIEVQLFFSIRLLLGVDYVDTSQVWMNCYYRNYSQSSFLENWSTPSDSGSAVV